MLLCIFLILDLKYFVMIIIEKMKKIKKNLSSVIKMILVMWNFLVLFGLIIDVFEVFFVGLENK